MNSLEEVFVKLKEALAKDALDLKHFETDYMVRYSFSISKYKLNHHETNQQSPEAN